MTGYGQEISNSANPERLGGFVSADGRDETGDFK
jgi:hypothetical protein